VSRFTTALGKYACALFCNCTLYRCSIEFLVRCCLRVRAGKSSVRDFRRRRVANHWMSFVFTSSCWPICSCNAQSRVKTGCSHADLFICTLSPPHARESSVSPHACIYPIYQDTANRLAASISIFTASPSEPLVQPRVPSTPSAWVSASHHLHSITVQRISS